MIWRVKLPNCAAISEWFVSASGTPELSAVDTVRVVARERVVHRVPERRLDLLRRDHALLRRAVEQHPHPLAADAELPHAIDQALRVAHRRHVRVRDDEDRVGRVQRADACTN